MLEGMAEEDGDGDESEFFDMEKHSDEWDDSNDHVERTNDGPILD